MRLICLDYWTAKQWKCLVRACHGMGEESKSKLKFDEKKVCEAEEVREYFINPKIENLWLVCKLSYFQLKLQKFHASLVKIYCQK